MFVIPLSDLLVALSAVIVLSIGCVVMLKVTEDANVGELFAITMRRETEEEGPLQSHQAPDRREVQAARV